MKVRLVTLAAVLTLAQNARAERCLDDRLVLAPAGPWQVALSAGAGVGVFFATHGRVGLSAGRRFFDRVEVELSLHYDGAAGLSGHEEAVRVGLLLHLSRHWGLLLGWRVGHARFVRDVGDGVAVSALVASVMGEARLALTPSWALRLSPLVFTGYWNEVWGFTLEPTVGVGYRF